MNTYRWIAQNGDGTYTVGEGDIEIAVCKHRDDAIWLKEAGYEPAAWLVTEYHINELQAESIQQLIDRAKHAHTADIKLRIEGQDEWYEADWLKHLARATPPQREEMQEPVAWMCPDDPDMGTAFHWKAGHCENCGKQRVPLYTAPPQRVNALETLNAELIETLERCVRYGGLYPDICEEARAALAKAKGEA